MEYNGSYHGNIVGIIHRRNSKVTIMESVGAGMDANISVALIVALTLSFGHTECDHWKYHPCLCGSNLNCPNKPCHPCICGIILII